ncbi:MAG: sulfurtransferase-like selenium metabolism protein YedF [Dehalococcoidales bacterium]|nr:sulfurtransferase-like selenium metabolism protein YedF [Dehalococcoidales bacterium]
MKQIDCRGLSCPHPVLLTKKALEESGNEPLKILLDSTNALQNVKRFASSQNHQMDLTEKDGVFELIIKPGRENETRSDKTGSYVVLITSEVLGGGDENLGTILIKSFLNTLWQNNNLPTKILFLNSGVKLACEGSNVLDTLNLLKEAGVSIVSCGTCLAYYELTDKLNIGYTGNMYEIVESLLEATKVIKI